MQLSMATDAAFLKELEADLWALSADARKTDSLATHITSWLQHTDFAQIKQCAETALQRLRAGEREGRGIEAAKSRVGVQTARQAACGACRLLVVASDSKSLLR